MTMHVKGLFFGYGNTEVLKKIDFSVKDGEVVSLVGPNGAGKSTLLKCLNRILTPSQGSVFVDDVDVKKTGLKKMARTFGYVPQTAVTAFPVTVFDTVLLGRRPYVDWLVGSDNRNVVCDMLIRLNLEHLAQRYFNELSGGEQQRALIARALAQEPRVLLLDEPTSNLDLRHQLEVLQHVVSIVKEKRVSVIMAIHDLNLAARYSDRIIFLKKGEIVMSGPPEEALVSKNIRSVYEVEAVVNTDSGRPHIVPVSITAN